MKALLFLLVLSSIGCLAPDTKSYCEESIYYLTLYQDKCGREIVGQSGSCSYVVHTSEESASQEDFETKCVPFLAQACVEGKLPAFCHVKFKEMF